MFQITIQLEFVHLLDWAAQGVELSPGERLPGHERDLGNLRYTSRWEFTMLHKDSPALLAALVAVVDML